MKCKNCNLFDPKGSCLADMHEVNEWSEEPGDCSILAKHEGRDPEPLHHPEYGGTYTRLIDLEPETSFWVDNGAWWGYITEDKKLTVVAYSEKGPRDISNDDYLWITIQDTSDDRWEIGSIPF
jgi:hypothetical protein